MSRTRLLVLATLAVSLPAAAFAQPLSMAEYWPNDDGRQWIYDQHYEEFFPGTDVIDDQARLWFDGTTTAPIANPAQYLRGEVTGLPSAPRGLHEAPASIGDPFLRQLWLARPDLRSGILAAAQESPCPVSGPSGWNALMITGEHAFVADPTGIFAWRCNLADTRSWLWLVLDLTPGNTFVQQLIPDLAPDVFLHGTIVGLEGVTVPAGPFADCLRVDYRIDYGEASCTGAGSPDPTGTYRPETLGSVWYAPLVGPVKTEERFIPYAEIVSGDCDVDPALIGAPATFTTLDLAMEPGVPVETSTWGRIKAAYASGR